MDEAKMGGARPHGRADRFWRRKAADLNGESGHEGALAGAAGCENRFHPATSSSGIAGVVERDQPPTARRSLWWDVLAPFAVCWAHWGMRMGQL